jgi:hypothetical protein
LVAVYWIKLSGQPFERLMADPQAAGLPDEVQSAALYSDFELHVMWPERDAFYLILDGDGDVQELVGLVSDYLAGGGWQAEVTRVPDAEDPPYWLEAGEQAGWVIEEATRGASEGETRTCRLCQFVGVPPHGPPCAAEKKDDGSFTVRSYPPRDSGGEGTSEEPEREYEVTSAAPARAT